MFFGELFSGPGGIALGAHQAAEANGLTLTHAWANDLDFDSCETYVNNIPGATAKSVHHEDVRSLDIGRLSPIEGFAFGFPCNDFSTVGERLGVGGKFGPLYSYGVDVLNQLNPNWFFAENVGGIRSSGDGSTFRKILADLSSAGLHGYKVVPHLYKFEEYGVPQARHRVIVIGIRNDLDFEFHPPSPAPFREIDVSSRTCLESPPIDPSALNNELTKQSPTVIRRLEYIKPGQNAFNADLPEDLKLNVKGAKISQIYKRLDPDKPSYTITASGGGGTHVYHYAEPRALTNRERARLQSFPDHYRFYGGKESVRKQIGMAVPVAGARVVFDALFKTLNSVSYESCESNLREHMPPDAQRDQEALFD